MYISHSIEIPLEEIDSLPAKRQYIANLKQALIDALSPDARIDSFSLYERPHSYISILITCQLQREAFIKIGESHRLSEDFIVDAVKWTERRTILMELEDLRDGLVTLTHYNDEKDFFQQTHQGTLWHKTIDNPIELIIDHTCPPGTRERTTVTIVSDKHDKIVETF